MVMCKLTLVDWFTKKEIKKAIMPADPLRAANVHSKLNPNSSVLLEWTSESGENKSVTLKPYNMESDLLLVEDEEDMLMTMDQFTKKWYGKMSKSRIQEIKNEVTAAYAVEDEE
jgi:hypothetical protein